MSIIQLTASTIVTGFSAGEGPPAYWPIFPSAWFLILTTLAVVTFLVVRRNRAEAPRRAGEARLAETYAAGEIDAEEYRSRLSVLRNP